MPAGSPYGLMQIQRMQGIEWGDGAGHDYHLWIDGATLYTDAQFQITASGILIVTTLEAANAASGSNGTGGALSVLSGNGDGTGAGGALSVTAGTGGATGAGGAVNITAGQGGTTSGAGGNLNLFAGTPNGGNSNGGVTTVKGGAANGTGAGGNILLSAGNSSTTSTSMPGKVQVAGGTANAGSGSDGGRVQLFAGAKDGSGKKPLIELDGSGDVPTTAQLASGCIGLKFNAGGTLVAYVNDAGTIKSLSLGTPA